MERAPTKTTYIIAFWFAGIACSFASYLMFMLFPLMILTDSLYVRIVILIFGWSATNVIGFYFTLKIFSQLNPRKMLPWIALFGVLGSALVGASTHVSGLNWFIFVCGVVAVGIQCIAIAYVFRERMI